MDDLARKFARLVYKTWMWFKAIPVSIRNAWAELDRGARKTYIAFSSVLVVLLIAYVTTAVTMNGGEGSVSAENSSTSETEPASEVIEPQVTGFWGSPNTSTCTAVLTDGIPAELVSVTIAYSAGIATLSFTFAEPYDTTAETVNGYYVTIFSNETDAGYQIGFKSEGSTQIENFIFDLGSAQQINLQSKIGIKDNSLLITMSSSLLTPLGNKFHWYATTTVEGQDVDSCGSIENPVKVTG